jgi:hypothetical protein
MEMHALVEEIAALVAKIKSGEATLTELEAFAAAANQLNERAIVLRYKAYESQVYGRPHVVAEQPVFETPQPAKEEIAPIIEAQETHPEPQVETSFDLFGLAEEEEETPEEVVPFELVEEVVEEPAEEPMEEAVQEQLHWHSEVEEKAVAEPEPAFAAPIEHTQNLHPIYGKLNSNDGTLAARLMSVRLDTLKGAFGFNERLQIIQELFNGSNDEFNHLIDQLEAISSKEQARSLVSSYANKYQWDSENQLAIELIQKVERKYA